jgi:hypothetical protein
MEAVLYSFLFLVLNVLALQVIVWLKGKRGAQRPQAASPPPTAKERLKAENILEWEYEYIRHTASEAMQDRHTMINFYLVLVGVVASGVLANLDKLQKWEGAATLLLWSVCGVGWFHFLILVRLREAWHESLLALIQLRDFYVRYSGTENFPSDELMKAFRWRRETLPTADKPWSVFHYSALLIALLDSMAFGVGGHLLSAGWNTVSFCTISLLVVLSIALFAYHSWVYWAILSTAEV